MNKNASQSESNLTSSLPCMLCSQKPSHYFVMRPSSGALVSHTLRSSDRAFLVLLGFCFAGSARQSASRYALRSAFAPEPGAHKKKYLLTFVGGISFWSSHPDSNWRPHPYHGCALPTELWEQLLSFVVQSTFCMGLSAIGALPGLIPESFCMLLRQEFLPIPWFYYWSG